MSIATTARRLAAMPFRNRLRVWNQPPFQIYYRANLDGAGRMFAPYFVNFLRREFPGGVETLFEWCSGPGFIGFSLLATGVCRCLVLADVNPRAIACVAKTVRTNKLDDKVRYYVSDNLEKIPSGERFDAVVANPPFYCALNVHHPLYPQVRGDLRTSDPGWKTHEDFYRSVGAHLNADATLFIMEVEPSKAVYFTPGFSEPWDIRPRPPIDDFQRMIAAGGLRHIRTEPFIEEGEYSGHLVISGLKKPGD